MASFSVNTTVTMNTVTVSYNGRRREINWHDGQTVGQAVQEAAEDLGIDLSRTVTYRVDGNTSTANSRIAAGKTIVVSVSFEQKG